jgi:tRNA 2-thiouridine synthesizing protein A
MSVPVPAWGTMVNVSMFGRRGRAASQPTPIETSPVLEAGAASGETAARAARTPLLTIDALGRKCPIPIIMLAAQVADVPVGQVIAVRADDPAAYTDIPSWCGLKSHELVYRDTLASGWEFGIRRQY